MSPKKIKNIKDEVLRLQQAGGKRVRYPEQIKQSVLKILNSGMGLSEVSRATGLNAPAILKWSQKLGDEFRTVKISEKISTNEMPGRFHRTEPICIVTSGGIRIECSSTTQLKEVLELLK